MSTRMDDQLDGNSTGAPWGALPNGIAGGTDGVRHVERRRTEDRTICESSPLLTVIVPVYNERATVDCLLKSVLGARYAKQIIVVDDGSDDGSSEVLEQWRQAGRIELLSHARNQGKGAAIRAGLRYARGEFTIIQDADLEYDPRDYARLLRPLLDGKADAVYGSRRLGRGRAWRQIIGPFRKDRTLTVGSLTEPARRGRRGPACWNLRATSNEPERRPTRSTRPPSRLATCWDGLSSAAGPCWFSLRCSTGFTAPASRRTSSSSAPDLYSVPRSVPSCYVSSAGAVFKA
jgi:hypothetical protein